MIKGELPFPFAFARHDRQDSLMPEATMSNNTQASSNFTPKQQYTSPRDIPQVSQELSKATTRLNATLDGSNLKMQRIIDETRAQLPDQREFPQVPRTANKMDASPPWHCGCEDELCTTDGCQYYKVVTNAAADLAAGLRRGLKRKRPMGPDPMWKSMVEEDESPLAGGDVEKSMLQWHPDDRSPGAASKRREAGGTAAFRDHFVE